MERHMKRIVIEETSPGGSRRVLTRDEAIQVIRSAYGSVKPESYAAHAVDALLTVMCGTCGGPGTLGGCDRPDCGHAHTYMFCPDCAESPQTAKAIKDLAKAAWLAEHREDEVQTEVRELTEVINRVQKRVDGATQEHVRNGVGVPTGQYDLRTLLDAARKWAAWLAEHREDEA
jgi:hypothetical protein